MEKEAVICAILIFVTASAASGQDGHMSCSDTWVHGQDVTLTCEINKASIASKCVTQQNSTYFLKNEVPQCDVGREEYTNCLSQDNSSQPASCWCQQNDTFFIFKHKFSADRFIHDGSWTCHKMCFDSGGVDNPLDVQTDAECDTFVAISKCFKNGQCKRGTCRINENKDDVCDCTGTGYIGTSCEISKCDKNGQCKRGTCRINKNKGDFCDCTGTGYVGTFCEKLDPFLIALICVSTLLGLLMAANCAGVYCARKQRSGGQQNAPPADAPPANAFLANAVPVNAPPDNAPPDNAPPDNAPQVAGSAGPFTGQAVPTTPYDEPEFSVAGSEASEGTEYSASEVSEV